MVKMVISGSRYNSVPTVEVVITGLYTVVFPWWRLQILRTLVFLRLMPSILALYTAVFYRWRIQDDHCWHFIQ